jgi:hypothetical protein
VITPVASIGLILIAIIETTTKASIISKPQTGRLNILPGCQERVCFFSKKPHKAKKMLFDDNVVFDFGGRIWSHHERTPGHTLWLDRFYR